MADKRIQDLTPASQVQTSDRFVLEQSGQAKSLTGQILINDLAAFLDGHGGISDISYTPPSSGELDGTLTVTLADETVETFTVTNGKGIASITKTAAVPPSLTDTYTITYNDGSTPFVFTIDNGRSIESIAKTDTQDLVDEYTIYYNDDTTSTFTVTNGEKGDTGDNWYVHIKWSATEPTQDSDMSDTPDNWIGIYSGLGETAPTSYSEYTWFEYKGETGDTGNGIESISIYSSSGVVDTYRVLFTNGSTTTFDVTNGSNISSITKTSSAGLTDTYTVTLTNGDTTSFTVSNAKSITSITPPGNPGLPGQTDRYIINFNNGDATFFDVYNGTNGTGSVSLVDNIAPVGGSVPLLTFGNGAPTVDTPGSVKSRYFDTLNNQLYICVAVDEESTPNTYTWRGSSVTVDSYLSTTSTNPVQNAVLTALLGTTPLDTTAQTLTEAVNEILDDISGFADNLAEEYDATATYAVGDLRIYNNTLYRCNTAISTPEAWNSIHWTQTSLAEDKVSKSGDTMTGQLNITDINRSYSAVSVKDPDYGISNLPSSTIQPYLMSWAGNDGQTMGTVRGYLNANGDSGVTISGRNRISGSTRLNYASLIVKSDGTTAVDLSAPDAWLTELNAVNKAGDTMTGNLVIDSANNQVLVLKNSSDDATVNPSSTYAGRALVFVDKNNVAYGYVRPRHYASGNMGLWLYALNPSGTPNSLGLYIDASGNRTVDITAAPWLNALGLGTSGALPITIAQGGSGQTAVTSVTTASSIVTAASGITVASAAYYQWGKVAQLRAQFKKTTAQTTAGSITLGTLVSGKRPINLAPAVCNMQSLQTAYISSSGVIYAYGTVSANTEFGVVATYLLPN